MLLIAILTHIFQGLEGKDYLCGSKFTMADVFFYPLLAIIVRKGATLSAYPALKKYYDTVTSLPPVKRTWPPHWNDGPRTDHLAML